MSSTISNIPRSELPSRFVTQTLPPAIDAKSAAAVAGLEFLDLARIRSGKSRDMRAKGIGDPDPVLLIDAKVEWSYERLARFDGPTLADDPALGWITLGK